MPESIRRIYSNPPVVERAVSVVAKIDLEIFERQLNAWQQAIKEDFPDYEAIPQWLLHVQQPSDGKGPPIFDPSKAEVQMHHQFWRRNARGNRFSGIQLRPNLFTVHFLRELNEGHTFEDVSEVLQKWLPRWIDTFEINELHGVRIEYVNIITAHITPKFIDGTGIQISNVFRLFSSLPLKHEGLVPPYDCQMTVICDKLMPCYLTIHVFGSEWARQPAVQIRFRARTDTEAKKLELNQVDAEIEFCHLQVIQAFEELFTPEAKESFIPQ